MPLIQVARVNRVKVLNILRTLRLFIGLPMLGSVL